MYVIYVLKYYVVVTNVKTTYIVLLETSLFCMITVHTNTVLLLLQ